MRVWIRQITVFAAVTLASDVGLNGCARASEAAIAVIRVDELPNALRVHGDVICGGQPDGLAGFQALQQLGVQTIVSVDGVPPDLATANAFGMRYLHLPLGYAGITATQAHTLARVIHQRTGPVYLHCHHGKHRSPAAAAVGLVGSGAWTTSEGEFLLQRAGTGPDYRGLWHAVAAARPLTSDQLAVDLGEFPESVQPRPLVDAMSQLEMLLGRLDKRAEQQWESATENTGQLASHDALLLQEQFAEALRLDSVQDRSAAFVAKLKASQERAAILERLLQGNGRLREPPGPRLRQQRQQALTSLHQQCRDCHQQFRD